MRKDQRRGMTQYDPRGRPLPVVLRRWTNAICFERQSGDEEAICKNHRQIDLQEGRGWVPLLQTKSTSLLGECPLTCLVFLLIDHGRFASTRVFSEAFALTVQGIQLLFRFKDDESQLLFDEARNGVFQRFNIGVDFHTLSLFESIVPMGVFSFSQERIHMCLKCNHVFDAEDSLYSQYCSIPKQKL